MVAKIETAAPRQGVQIPIALRLKAQNLYLVKCLEPVHVAAATGLTRDQVSQLATRYGWVKLRRERMARAHARMDEKLAVPIDEVSDAIAKQCDEYALKALERTGKALASDLPLASRDAQSFSGALMNLVKVGRLARGLDGGGKEPTQITNLAFFSIGRAAPDPVNVTATAPIELPAAPTA